MSLARFSIGTRLGAGFACMLALTALIAGTGAWRLSVAAEEYGLVMADPLAQERLASEWYRLTTASMARTVAIARSNDAGLEAQLADDVQGTTQRINEIVKQLQGRSTGDEERRLIATINERRVPYLAARDAIIAARRAGKTEEAVRLFGAELSPALQPYLESVRAYLDHQRGTAEAAAAAVRSDAANARTALALLGLLAVALGAGLAWALTRSIRRPLAVALEHARAVAEGDLTRPMEVRGHDEVAGVLRALQEMQARLGALVSQVRQGVDSVSTASQEIARGNSDLSQRTEQAASSLQQTASSMEELTSTVRQTADSARTANQLASSASTVARRGGSVVAQVVSTMDEINASSKRIADIIGTIDGIAFQTNILALNAAVEAARAGEQGRGFAVVAGEVRSLAQRSAEAAREIKSLIGASVDKVESGSRLVADAGSTMNEIVASVQRVSDIIGEISAAAAEQSSGIAQVNNAVAQLDQATQQNAALVEQSAAAAESLQDQARQLTTVVAAFRTGQACDAPAAPAPARQARQAIAQARDGARAPAVHVPAATAAPAAPGTAGAAADAWETF